MIYEIETPDGRIIEVEGEPGGQTTDWGALTVPAAF